MDLYDHVKHVLASKMKYPAAVIYLKKHGFAPDERGNIGRGNSGCKNIGVRNDGDCNIGNDNIGDFNRGHGNIGNGFRGNSKIDFNY